jgi:hypothetical protein
MNADPAILQAPMQADSDTKLDSHSYMMFMSIANRGLEIGNSK